MLEPSKEAKDSFVIFSEECILLQRGLSPKISGEDGIVIL